MKFKKICTLLLCVLLLSSTFSGSFGTVFGSTALKEVNGKYDPVLLSETLEGNSKYSIVEFPVNLIDYDAAKFNAAYASKGDRFQFRGDVLTANGTNGINESTSTYAKQGILEPNLVNGLPKMKYGYDLGTVLFDENNYGDYKTVYKDAKFQFVRNNETGYYEYKSAANHAQYNSENNKVELYADSLSPSRDVVKIIDPTTYVGETDVIFTKSGSIITGTVTDRTGNNRLDPYFHYENLKTESQTIKTSDVDKIYIRAYLPGSIGSNLFKVYFTTDVSGQTGYQEYGQYLTKEYTQTEDGWVEFILDTSESSRWKGNLTGLRIDPYDSMEGNLPNSSYQFKISDIVLINSDDSNSSVFYYGGFYPFSEIENSTVGSADPFSYDKWAQVQENKTLNEEASRSIFKESPSGLDYLHFGMTMEFDFYMPVSGTATGLPNDTTTDSDNLRFEFTGDDDMWVFVDGKLVLDEGGGHGALNMYVDFTDREVYVENAVTVTGYDTNSGNAKPITTELKDDTLFEPGLHKVKIFYMERCGSVSNCFIKFNLPQTPEGDVVVSKSTVETNGNSTTIADETFEFVIEENGTPMANQPYTLMGVGVENSSGEVKNTNSAGKFTLKNGQFASFAGIDEYKRITVTETEKNIDGFDKVSTTVNGKTALSDTLTTLANKGINFSFVNTYTERSAVINYIRVMPEDYDQYKGYNDGGVVLGNVMNPKDVNEQVSETLFVKTDTAKGSTSAVIGEFPRQLQFVGWYTDEECTNMISEDPYFNPTRDSKGLNVSANYYAKFEYVYADLTINKTAKNANYDSNSNETQTFLYRVEGTDYFGDDIELTVAIDMQDKVVGQNGVGSMVIKDLPIGNYKVTELEDWSWRYAVNDVKVSGAAEGRTPVYHNQDNDSEFEKVEFFLSPTGTTVDYINNRLKPYWLSGDSYAENWWGGRFLHRVFNRTVITTNR